MKKEKFRYDYIDIMKGIGIVLVVLGHRRIPKNLHRFIYAFHMPLFFFISGYLFNQKLNIKFIDFFKKKFKIFIIPYFYFSIISIIVQFFLIRINIFNPINIKELIKGLFIIEGRPLWNVPLWFLVCLFFVQIIYFFIDKLSNKIPKYISVISITILGYFFVTKNLFTPFKISTAFTVIIFFYAGNLFKNIENKLNIHINKINTYVISILLILLTYYLSVYKNYYVDIDLLYYGNYIMFLINAFVGIILTYLISKQLINICILKFIGKNSLIIMSTHYIIFQGLQIFDRAIFKNEGYFSIISVKIAVFYTAITIILSIPLINLINNKIPFLIGKYKEKI